jgi:Rieske Fe-S protein
VSPEPVICPARRALLLSAGLGGVAVLAGCGDHATPSAAPASSAAVPPPAVSAGAPSAAPTTAPTTADPFAGVPTDNGGAAQPDGALVATADVPVGGGVLVQDNKLVVQPRSGVFKAYSAVCPHQGVTVPPPATGAAIMECPGHNSQFKTADGSLVRGPATRGLATIAVKIKNGYVVQA